MPSSVKNQLRRLCAITCYPLIVLILIGYSSFVLQQGIDLGLAAFSSVLIVIAYFIIIERLNPFKTQWHPSKKEWSRDGLCFILVIVYGAFSETLVRVIALQLAPIENTMSLAKNATLAILVGSFIGYWLHRLEHRHLFLWSFHGIHHRPNKVTVSNNSVVHFLEVLLSALVIQTSFLLLGFSAEGMFIAGQFTALHGYFIHANVNVRMGWLNYIVATPELHRFHHSVELKEAGNFGSDLSIWDQLFGSFFYRPGRTPIEVGVTKPHLFPCAFEVAKGILHPFRWFVSRRGNRPRYTKSTQLPQEYDNTSRSTPSTIDISKR
ncbi:sterol desaturase family protein [Pseudoalteromonas sp. S2755]|uniref:sterol desaturase family protein n=1 Tax=Pseudoalteromonas sp. S2755 TaxID=2066523 RepID=UPI0020163148|nr:sterol desaturase family protein [Pseudoalteromonas sp. S2755]